MRLIICLVLNLLFASCSQTKEPIQRLTEYEYPLDSLDHGKIFVFKRNHPEDYYFVEQRRVREGNADFIIQETYGTKQRISAEKFRITEDGQELVEAFLYHYPDSLSNTFTKDKAEIVENRNMEDGKQFRGTYSELRVSSWAVQGSSITKTSFSRTDKLAIGDNFIDVIVFGCTLETKASLKYLPFISSESIYTGENIYARRLGLIKYWTQKGTERLDWDLIEIRNIDQEK